MKALPALLFGPLLLACQAAPQGPPDSATGPVRVENASVNIYEPGLPVSRAPFDRVHAQWKERLAQPYVYVEHSGAYAGIGEAVKRLLVAAAGAGLQPSGPLFGLFEVEASGSAGRAVQARIALPVDGPVEPAAGLLQDVLPGTTVAYAFVGGPYSEISLAYPGLLEFVRERGWAVAGPVREIYLNPNPEAVTDPGHLITEVQVPWRSLR